MPEPADTPEVVESEETTTEQPELNDGGRKAIAAEREARKAAERQLAEMQKTLKAYEDAQKTELQKALERAEAAEKAEAEARSVALRTRIAAEKQVPLANLTGSTEEELLASAEALIAWKAELEEQLKAQAPPPAPKRSVLKSGATGAEPGSADPKVIAAERLRQFRAG